MLVTLQKNPKNASNVEGGTTPGCRMVWEVVGIKNKPEIRLLISQVVSKTNYVRQRVKDIILFNVSIY